MIKELLTLWDEYREQFTPYGKDFDDLHEFGFLDFIEWLRERGEG